MAPNAIEILGDTELLPCGKSKQPSALKASEALAGKVSLLYFSAHWCPPCRRFTPVLAKLYEKLKADGKEFELVFVSLDNDEGQFNEYTAGMPWLAVPFANQETLRNKLASVCGAQGIPHLVVLDADGSIITSEGTQEVMDDEGGERFPWRPPSFEEIWPYAVLSKNESGEVVQIPSADLKDKYLMLYFSAHWCPPCRQFTPKLSKAYTELKKQRDDFELVFLSSDKDEDSFKDYFGEMTFCAVPFGERDAKNRLSKRFGVRGIPKLLILGPAGEGGERPLINDNIRSAIESGDFSDFPFPKKNYGDLEGGEDLNDKRCLVVFHENGDDDEQEETKTIVKEVAEKLKDEEDMSFYWALEAGGICGQVKKLTKTEKQTEDPVVVLLDIPDNGGYYVSQGSELSTENLLKFINNPGERRQLG